MECIAVLDLNEENQVSLYRMDECICKSEQGINNRHGRTVMLPAYMGTPPWSIAHGPRIISLVSTNLLSPPSCVRLRALTSVLVHVAY